MPLSVSLLSTFFFCCSVVTSCEWVVVAISNWSPGSKAGKLGRGTFSVSAVSSSSLLLSEFVPVSSMFIVALWIFKLFCFMVNFQ